MSIFGPQTTNMLTTAVLLMLFAILGAILVGTTFTQTEDVIKHNEEITLLNKLNSIIPKQQYDNDLLLDKVILPPSSLLGTSEPTLAYRARKGDEDVAAVFSCIAPNGYSGSIFLLVVTVLALFVVVGEKIRGRMRGMLLLRLPGCADLVALSQTRIQGRNLEPDRPIREDDGGQLALSCQACSATTRQDVSKIYFFRCDKLLTH